MKPTLMTSGFDWDNEKPNHLLMQIPEGSDLNAFWLEFIRQYGSDEEDPTYLTLTTAGVKAAAADLGCTRYDHEMHMFCLWLEKYKQFQSVDYQTYHRAI